MSPRDLELIFLLFSLCLCDEHFQGDNSKSAHLKKLPIYFFAPVSMTACKISNTTILLTFLSWQHSCNFITYSRLACSGTLFSHRWLASNIYENESKCNPVITFLNWTCSACECCIQTEQSNATVKINTQSCSLNSFDQLQLQIIRHSNSVLTATLLEKICDMENIFCGRRSHC